jgi:hypothetical protein
LKTADGPVAARRPLNGLWRANVEVVSQMLCRRYLEDGRATKASAKDHRLEGYGWQRSLQLRDAMEVWSQGGVLSRSDGGTVEPGLQSAAQGQTVKADSELCSAQFLCRKGPAPELLPARASRSSRPAAVASSSAASAGARSRADSAKGCSKLFLYQAAIRRMMRGYDLLCRPAAARRPRYGLGLTNACRGG